MNTTHSKGYQLPPPEQAFSGAKQRAIFPVLLIVLAILLIEVFFVMGMGYGVVREHLAIFITVNGFIALALCFTQPFFLFVVIACYLPFTRTGIEIELAGVTFNPYTMGMILLVALAFVRKVLLGRNLNLGRSDFFLALICGSFLVSTLLSKDVTSSGFLAFNALFIPVCSLFVCRILLDGEWKYKMFSRAFIISLTIFGVGTILSFLISGRRAVAFNVQPIGAGSLLFFSICYLATTKMFPRLIRLAALGLCLLALLVTYSRVLILITILSPVFYFFIRGGKAVFIYITFFAFTMLFTVLMITSMDQFKPERYFKGDGEIHKTSERITNVDHWRLSLYLRIVTFKDSMDRFLAKPLFGTGLQKSFGATTEHNFNLEWLSYGGIFGYFLLLSFFMFHVKRVAKAAVRDPILNTNLLVLLGIMCNAFFNGIMHGFMPLIAYLVMGMSEARMINHEHYELPVTEDLVLNGSDKS